MPPQKPGQKKRNQPPTPDCAHEGDKVLLFPPKFIKPNQVQQIICPHALCRKPIDLTEPESLEERTWTVPQIVNTAFNRDTTTSKGMENLLLREAIRQKFVQAEAENLAGVKLTHKEYVFVWQHVNRIEWPPGLIRYIGSFIVAIDAARNSDGTEEIPRQIEDEEDMEGPTNGRSDQSDMEQELETEAQ